MGIVKVDISTSLDGFTAGPSQSEEHPLGIGGMDLHEWVFKLASWRRAHGREGGDENASSELVERSREGVGAHVMGRNMFGGGPGPWNRETPWEGWWGDEPPFHTPVYVLTSHAREPLEKQGGTTFYFVTDGIGSAIEQARAAAGEGDVLVAGGANVAQQALAAGFVDELLLHITPVLLGEGTRLLENLDGSAVATDGSGPALELIETVAASDVTHVRYRVNR